MLDGGSSDDTLRGGSGTGADGADTLIGGTGAGDTVSYANRTDDIDADLDGAADDGGAGENDTIATTVENLTGGAADDDLTGNSTKNVLDGGAGDDELFGGTGTGPDGADTFIGGSHGTVGGQNGFAGDDVEYGGRTDNLVISIGGGANDGGGGCPGGPGCEDDDVRSDVESISAGSGDDVLIGDASPSQFYFGRGGDDTMSGGSGTGPDGIDRFTGGADTDLVTYAGRTDDITADIGTPIGGGNDGAGSGCPSSTNCENDRIESDIERLTGGSGNDHLAGDSNPNRFIGGPGDDTMLGSLGGGPDGGDQFTGGTNGPVGDTVSYETRNDAIVADIGGGPNDGGDVNTGNATAGCPGGGDCEDDNISSDVENITGGKQDDVLTGGAGANRLSGGNGDDQLSGGTGSGPDGADTFIGGANTAVGDRVLYVGRTDDLILSIGGGPDAPEGDAIGSDIENLTGGDGDDSLTGDADANNLNGGNDGGDTFAGGTGTGPDGADVFRVGSHASATTDTVTYANRTDSISADIGGGADDSDGDDISSDMDDLIGGFGPDSLTGDGKANRIEGGPGSDSLSGLAGADLIAARDGAADTITCGTEADLAEIDEGAIDTVDADCETLDQPPSTPPVTSISAGPAGTVADATPTFEFAANEPATHECRIDSAAFAPCSSPFTSARLSDGPHTFTVQSTDIAGNLGTSVSRSFTVDASISGASLTGKGKQKQKGKKIKLKVAVSGQEPLSVTLGGTVAIKKGAKVALKPIEIKSPAGGSVKATLKPTSRGKAKKVAKALKKGKKVKATISAGFSDAVGNSQRLALEVKLK